MNQKLDNLEIIKQAVIEGQLEALKRLGFDITKPLYQQLVPDARNLTEIERIDLEDNGQ